MNPGSLAPPETPAPVAAPAGTPGEAAGGTPPAAPAPADWEQRYPELEATIPDRIRQETERVLADLFPDPLRGAPPEVDVPGQPGSQRGRGEPGPEGSQPEELSTDERVELLGQQLTQERQEREIQAEISRIQTELKDYQREFKYMEPASVLTFLARHGDRNPDLRRLCELDHKRNLARLEAYHHERLRQVRENPAPVIPSTPSATPGAPEPPKTFEGAKARAYELLRARGWGQGE